MDTKPWWAFFARELKNQVVGMEKLMDQVRDILESDPEVYLTRWDPQLLEGLEGGEP
jgi:hypothetical protein